MERIWDIQWFSWGESDDPVRWPKDSFYSGENIEVRKSLSGVQLAAKITDTGWTINGDIIAMANLATLGISSGGIVVCTSTGKIYLDWVLKTTLATWTSPHDRVSGIGVMTFGTDPYVYYISNTSFGAWVIHRSTATLSAFNVSYKSFTTAQTNSSPVSFVINADKNLNIAVNNKVIILTNSEVVVDKLEFEAAEQVRGLTWFQNSFKVYTNKKNSGIQYLWNGSSLTYEYRQEWENQPILWVTNDGAFDYAVLGFSASYSDLYLISGTQKQELRVNLESATSSRTLNRYMSIREAIVYISGGSSGESTLNGVYTFGNYYPWTPKSLVQQYSAPNWVNFLFHIHDLATSYFAADNSKVYTIEHNNPPFFNGYATTGYVVTQVHEGNSWEEKEISKIKVWFNLWSGDSIKVYIRKYLTDAWLLAKTIDATYYSGKKSAIIYPKDIEGLTFSKSETLQLKLEITSGGTAHTIPTAIKRVTVFMNVVNNG